jgi:hypothetical protein
VYFGMAFIMRSEECMVMLVGVKRKMLRAAMPKEIPATDSGTTV